MKALNKPIDPEEIIARQAAEFVRVRKALRDVCTIEELQYFLIINESDVVEGIENLLDRCADILCFGSLYKCQKCSKGDMIFTKHGYKCKRMDQMRKF
jgi:hypothetical protein